MILQHNVMFERKKKHTDMLSLQFDTTKNGKLMLTPTCASCSINKTMVVKSAGVALGIHRAMLPLVP